MWAHAYPVGPRACGKRAERESGRPARTRPRARSQEEDLSLAEQILGSGRRPPCGTWVGHRQSKPRSVQGPEGPDTHNCTLRPDPRRGEPQARRPSSCPHSRGDPTFTGGTLCRGARGLSSERGGLRVQSTSPCVCSEACLGGVPPAAELWSPSAPWPRGALAFGGGCQPHDSAMCSMSALRQTGWRLHSAMAFEGHKRCLLWARGAGCSDSECAGGGDLSGEGVHMWPSWDKKPG